MPIATPKTLNAQAGMLVAPISQVIPTLRDGVSTEKRKPSDDWMNRPKEFLKDARADREREELLVRVKDGLTALVDALTKLSKAPATVGGITGSQGHAKAAIAAWNRVIPSIEPYEKLRGRKLEFKSPWSTVKQLNMDAVLRALEWVELGFDRLAFYRTPAGEAWLLSALGFSDTPVPLPPGFTRVADDYVLNSVHPWGNEMQASAAFLQGWLTDVFTENDDDGVDLATGVIKNFLLNTYELRVRMDPHASQDKTGSERSNQAGSVRAANLVRIHTSSKFYPNLGKAPRMYTFQVRMSCAPDPKRPHKKYEWGSAADHHEGTDALPILRYVHATTMSARGNDDFCEGVLYAMDGPSRLYCAPPGRKHTALLEGCPASAAGVLVAKKGRVIAIDNRSGHYRPGYAQLRVAVRYLHNQQLFEPGAIVALLVVPGVTAYFRVPDFLRLAEGGMQFSAVAHFLSRFYKGASGAPPLGIADDCIGEPGKKPVPQLPYHKASGLNPPGEVDKLLCYMYGSGPDTLVALVDETMTWLAAEANGSTSPKSPGGVTGAVARPLGKNAPGQLTRTIGAQRQPFSGTGPEACAELLRSLQSVNSAYARIHHDLDAIARLFDTARDGAPKAAQARRLSARVHALRT